MIIKELTSKDINIKEVIRLRQEKNSEYQKNKASKERVKVLTEAQKDIKQSDDTNKRLEQENPLLNINTYNKLRGIGICIIKKIERRTGINICYNQEDYDDLASNAIVVIAESGYNSLVKDYIRAIQRAYNTLLEYNTIRHYGLRTSRFVDNAKIFDTLTENKPQDIQNKQVTKFLAKSIKKYLVSSKKKDILKALKLYCTRKQIAISILNDRTVTQEIVNRIHEYLNK